MNKTTIQELKDKSVETIKIWAEGRIDEFVASNPKFAIASVYLKRGVNNCLAKECCRINDMIDKAAIFVCNENGEVNMETMFDDMISVFRSIDEIPFESEMLKGTIGKGVIRFTLPDNPLISLLFGDIGTLKVTDTDLIELKNAFMECK